MRSKLQKNSDREAIKGRLPQRTDSLKWTLLTIGDKLCVTFIPIIALADILLLDVSGCIGTVARVKSKKNDTKDDKSFQLHHVFNMDNVNGAKETPTLIDRNALDEKQNEAIESAANELARRKGVLDENLKFAHELKVAGSWNQIMTFLNTYLKTTIEKGIV